MPLRIALLCVLLVSASGCQTLSAGEQPVSEPQNVLEKPASLNETSVQTYVEDLEKAFIYDDYPTDPSADDGVTCEASVGFHQESELALSVQCVGGISLDGGDHVDIARRTHYYVSPDVVKRSPPSNADSRDHDGPQDDPTQGGPGYEVVNFADKPANVTATFPEGAQDSEPLQFTYEIGPNESVIQNDLPFEFDSTPSMSIESDDTRTTGHLRSDPGGVQFAHPTVVYVLPSGSVTIAQVNSTV